MTTISSIRAASVTLHYDRPADLSDAGVRTWVARGSNFVVTVSEAEPGAVLARIGQRDEYMVFLTDATATIQAGDEVVQAESETLSIVPPGDSKITTRHGGQVICIFSSEAHDLLAIAGNARDYDEPNPDVAPLAPWPAPKEGFKLRNYRIADFTKEDSNMRIFRCTNLMLNVLTPRMVARDVRKLSPHSHADFEQGSLAIKGRWTHHLRYPWGSDMTTWRDDEAIEVGSPSLTVIPPKVIHTSRNTNDGGAWLLDIFSPPRLDFALEAGKVANEADYPLPQV